MQYICINLIACRCAQWFPFKGLFDNNARSQGPFVPLHGDACLSLNDHAAQPACFQLFIIFCSEREVFLQFFGKNCRTTTTPPPFVYTNVIPVGPFSFSPCSSRHSEGHVTIFFTIFSLITWSHLI